MDLKFHPASEIFLLMEGQEFEELCDRIHKNGLLVPIMLHPDGSILDGRNRYRACLELNVEPRFETWDENGSAADLVWDLNFVRRQLDTTIAKAMASARYTKELEREAKQRREGNLRRGCEVPTPPAGDVGELGRSVEKAAKKFGIGDNTVSRTIRVLEHGDPELIQKLERKEINITPAAELAAATPEKQREVLEMINKGKISAKSKDILDALEKPRRVYKPKSRTSQGPPKDDDDREPYQGIEPTKEEYKSWIRTFLTWNPVRRYTALLFISDIRDYEGPERC